MDLLLEEGKVLCKREIRKRGACRESEGASGNNPVGKEKKTGVVTCKGYYDRINLGMQ